MLTRFGVVISADQLAQMKVENIAAVLVTAELSPYQRAGGRIDVIASSIGDARSLQGGTLLPTPLRGPTGEEVAMAQGPLSIGGFGGGSGGSSVQVNHLTVGRIPGGAVVEMAPPTPMPATGTLTFSLREPDFVTASHVAEAINTQFGGTGGPRHRSGQRGAGGARRSSRITCPSSWRSSKSCPSKSTRSPASSSTSARARSSSAATCGSGRRPSRTAICR